MILKARSAIEGERKPVTALFCDLADSTALAERLGTERMNEVFNAFFEVALTEVHRYQGTVNQFLGDDFMALFGAPVSHGIMRAAPCLPRSRSARHWQRSASRPERSGCSYASGTCWSRTCNLAARAINTAYVA
jgi:class 3 adenylate cyclase